MDHELINKAVSGDPQALTVLIDKYKDLAFNLAVSIVRNGEDAMDIIQDSFLKVLENIGRFRNESKFSTWLYRIVYNRSIQYLNKKRKSDYINIDTVKNIPYPDNSSEKREDYSKLIETINELEEREYTVVSLFYLNEKSIKDIKTITGLSTSNIKVILYRARKKLYQNLKSSYERT